KETVGQIMSRTVDDIQSFQEILGWGWRIVGSIFWQFLGAFIAIFLYSQALALLFLLIIPLVLYSLNFISGKSRVFYDTKVKYGDLNDVMAENFSGIRTVKSFGREFDQIEAFKKKHTIYSTAATKQVRLRAILQPGMIFLIYLGVLLMLFAGGIFNQVGIISSGVFISFILLVIQISVPGRFLGELGIFLTISSASAQRLNEVLKAKQTPTESPSAIELPPIKECIVFEDVSFTYPGSDLPVLEKINLRITAGERIAILGSTGSGKTTLINLLPRFFDVTSGRILIDGTDIRELTLRSLRKRIGIVHQDNFLFTISLHDNIAFGNHQATREQVIEAARVAQIHDFIDSLPQGYDSLVGERVVTLSGGQKQRVTIARALITDPDVLILDDSVSAVDPETEAELQKTLKKTAESRQGRIGITISQRPGMLESMDRIIVLSQGKIVQEGSHKDLVQVRGLYHDFIQAIQHQIKFIDWERSVETGTEVADISGAK
ncbi:MAG TPA: ABC transporter ATP-binding protein, partial [Candidatus Hodarchaeales archaeon]|nr:ABC transporter ATP-binding protein [Candidatus Hodarchaeales archaeon]